MAAVSKTSHSLTDSKYPLNAKEPTAKTMESAKKTDFIWEGFVAAKAPNGQWIPVQKPVQKADENGMHYGPFHASYCRLMLGNTICPENPREDNVTYRTKDQFDYSPYGLIKIGQIWVNPNHPIAVQCAQEILKKYNAQNKCVIL